MEAQSILSPDLDPSLGSPTWSAEIARPDRALVALGKSLQAAGYRFTTVTPLTHRRVNARETSGAHTLADIFGWSRPFPPECLPKQMLRHLEDAGALESSAGWLRSAVRFSTLGRQLFIHSAFPTEQADAVFFGPDTYRFARVIEQCIKNACPLPRRVLDVGAGSGAGGLHAAALLGNGSSVVLSDINRNALRFSRVNAAINDIAATEVVESDLFEQIDGQFDLIVANPPYLVDPLGRLYRHGGGTFGEGLSARIFEQSLDRLAPRGRLVLYTGTAIVAGVDTLYQALRPRIDRAGARFTYEEIDPDVFGEELEHPPYDQADRIAVVAVTATRDNS
jgi:methylase of polypeptide subunit release factors